MQKYSWLVPVILLVVGLGVGYYAGLSKDDYGINDDMEGMHNMSDGSVMEDEDMSMEDMMDGMNAELMGKSGDAFDQAFLSEMIVHHEGAVEMAELALDNAKHQEIIDLAKAITAAQNAEIADMKEWQETWYGENR